MFSVHLVFGFAVVVSEQNSFGVPQGTILVEHVLLFGECIGNYFEQFQQILHKLSK